ncbi:MAG: cupin domain-containing protein [Terriglobia bacterium]
MSEEKKSDRLEALVAAPADLGGLVQYQEGSVVSRTILSRQTGTVTLFAFDAGQGLSEHTAPFDATVYVLTGEAEIDVSGHPFAVKEGQVVILPANQPHAVRAAKSFKMMLIMVRA